MVKRASLFLFLWSALAAGYLYLSGELVLTSRPTAPPPLAP